MPAIASVRMLGFELAEVLIFASGYSKLLEPKESNRANKGAQYLTAWKGEPGAPSLLPSITIT